MRIIGLTGSMVLAALTLAAGAALAAPHTAHAARSAHTAVVADPTTQPTAPVQYTSGNDPWD